MLNKDRYQRELNFVAEKQAWNIDLGCKYEWIYGIVWSKGEWLVTGKI